MRLVIEYHEELEIDLLPDHDLLDVWRGELSWRRLELLIRHLPASSLLVRSLAPETAAAAEWDATTYVLADYFDLFARAKFQNPKPYPRPADLLRERARAEARREALLRQRERVMKRKG